MSNRNVNQLFLDNLFPKLENLFREERTKEKEITSLDYIEEFFKEIECNSQNPDPQGTPLPNFRDSITKMMMVPIVPEDSYTQLLNKEILLPKSYVFRYVDEDDNERRLYLQKLSASEYIENLLISILNGLNRSEIVLIDRCIKLLMCPVRTYFQQFTKFLNDPETEGAAAARINFFAMFTSLTNKILNKKLEILVELLAERELDLSVLENFNRLGIFSEIIITLLASKYIMIYDWLVKIDTEGGFVGDNVYYEIIESFIETKQLYKRYLDVIEFIEIKIGDKRRTYNVNLTKLENLRDKVTGEDRQRLEEEIERTKTQIAVEERKIIVLENTITLKLDEIDQIERVSLQIEDKIRGKSEAVTPPRPPRPPRPLVPPVPAVPPVPVPVPVPPRSPAGFRSPPGFRSPAGFRQQGRGGTRYKRVKRKYSKMKKYKNKFSKTKKYKNKFSKKKKYKS
jgi:hypothetical protein